MSINPFSFLEESIDPMIEAIAEEESPLNDPFLSSLNIDSVRGNIQIPAGGKIDIYQMSSSPAIWIGDAWGYQSGTRTLNVGELKLKKMTLQVRVSEDEMDRMKQLGADSLVGKEVANEIRRDVGLLKDTLAKYVIDPWGGVTTSTEYDSQYVGIFKGSNTGTLSDPSDLNSTAGTADTITGNWTGSQKTSNIMSTFASEVARVMYKEDNFSGNRIDVSTNKHLLVHPLVKQRFENDWQELNSTTGQLALDTYAVQLQKAGFTIVENRNVDTTYAGADGDTTTAIVYANPKRNFSILVNEPPQGTGWSAWKEMPVTSAGLTVISYEKHKKIEFAVKSQGYLIFTSTTASSIFKNMARFTITPYDNTA